MTEQQAQLEHLSEIRYLMESNTRFLSLSGASGIAAGCVALAGIVAGDAVVEGSLFNPDRFLAVVSQANDYEIWRLMIVAALTLVLALGTALFFSAREASRRGQFFWSKPARKMAYHFFVPMMAGGIFCLALLQSGLGQWLAPVSLLFFGIALFNSSKFSYRDLNSMGLAEIILGLAGLFFPQWGLYFWAIGFGAINILYGAWMHYRYSRA